MVKFRNALFFSILSTVLLLGCRPNVGGGICITFDDDHFDSWYQHLDLLKKYNIKATFFITRPHLMDSTAIFRLNKIAADGHEIACHSLTHQLVLDYENNLEALLNEEVYPANRILDSLGYPCTSYAYPFGKSTEEIDDLMLNHFDYLRKATWNYNDTLISTYNEIFVSKPRQNITNAMGIDVNYNISLENIENALLRAKEESEVLVVYAHRITENPGEYQVSPQYLEAVFQLCEKHHIRSVLFKNASNFWSN